MHRCIQPQRGVSARQVDDGTGASENQLASRQGYIFATAQDALSRMSLLGKHNLRILHFRRRAQKNIVGFLEKPLNLFSGLQCNVH